MRIRIVAHGLQPPLTDAIYNHGEDYEVPDERAVDFLNRSWAVPLREPIVEVAVSAEPVETAAGKRQRKV